MSDLKFVRAVPAKVGERIAIMARTTETSPWVQVESILGTPDDIKKFCEELEYNTEERQDYVDTMAEEEWDEDAPPENWNG